MSSAPSRQFLFLLASARADGNAEQLARRAAASLPAAVRQTWVRLADHPLPAFVDRRHETDEAWAPAVDGAARFLLESTLASTDLVFVAPVYWYSLPTAAKLYLDHWSAWLRAPGWDFKARMAGKTMWAISSFSDTDPALATPLRDTLRLTADYMQMSWGGFLLGEGNRPGDVQKDARAHAAAETFFTRPTD
ncbi:MAG: NAD(P)H-dependent oxidoreductase [Opitutae bacterium]|nr:NAD(P)H-dependent oxidoreductase [Opitutae bacterium]